MLRHLARLIARSLGLRFIVAGLEELPRARSGRVTGGWIAAGFPHRTWIEPFAMVLLLPVEPRPIFLGDARAIFRTPLRRLLFRLVGGVIPIRPEHKVRAFEAHVRAAEAVIRARGVFALFPEMGGPVPAGQARPFAAGLGYIALRTGAPIVPLVFGGTDELYLGRRIVMRVLPAATAEELLLLPAGASLPLAGSAEERKAAHAVVASLHERTRDAVAEADRAAAPAPGTKKRLRRLTRSLH